MCSDEEHRWRTHMKNTCMYEEHSLEQSWRKPIKSKDEKQIWRA